MRNEAQTPDPKREAEGSERKHLLVYIACPYTIGDVPTNIRNSMDAAERLRRLGCIPVNPLLNAQHCTVHRLTYEEVMQWDLGLMRRCDVVVRLPGESKGADRECQEAIRLGIPHFLGMDPFLDWYLLCRERDNRVAKHQILETDEFAQQLAQFAGEFRKTVEEGRQRLAEIKGNTEVPDTESPGEGIDAELG